MFISTIRQYSWLAVVGGIFFLGACATPGATTQEQDIQKMKQKVTMDNFEEWWPDEYDQEVVEPQADRAAKENHKRINQIQACLVQPKEQQVACLDDRHFR